MGPTKREVWFKSSTQGGAGDCRGYVIVPCRVPLVWSYTCQRNKHVITKHFRYLKWRYSPIKAVCKADVSLIRFSTSILGTSNSRWCYYSLCLSKTKSCSLSICLFKFFKKERFVSSNIFRGQAVSFRDSSSWGLWMMGYFYDIFSSFS